MSDYSNAQEYRLREMVREAFPRIRGIERVPLSGAAALTKGDIGDAENLLPLHIDHKSTRGRNSISIRREDLEKVALQGARKPFQVMSVGFYGSSTMYGVIDLRTLLALIAFWNDKHRGGGWHGR